METQKFFTSDIKIENDSEANDLICETEFIEIESIDIKEEVIEGKIYSSY